MVLPREPTKSGIGTQCGFANNNTLAGLIPATTGTAYYGTASFMLPVSGTPRVPNLDLVTFDSTGVSTNSYRFAQGGNIISDSSSGWLTLKTSGIFPAGICHVASASVTSGGSGYTSAPTVTFSSPYGNSAIVATGTAVITSGAVSAINIVKPGAGYYQSPPSITISGGGGGGATAVASLSAPHPYMGYNIHWDNAGGLTSGEVHYVDTIGISTSPGNWQAPGTTVTNNALQILGNHIYVPSGVPGITAGAGAGSSPSVSVSGSDQAGTITINTGSSPTTGAVVATINFSSTFTSTPRAVILTPGNSNAAVLSGANQIYEDSASRSTSSFALKVGSGGLTSGVPYIFNYQVMG